MRKLLKPMGLTVAVMAMTLMVSNVVLAQEDEERHIIRGYAGYLTTTGDNTLNLSDIELDDSGGYGLGYELKVSPLIGIPIDYSKFGSEVDIEDVGSGDSDFNPITLGLMFHFVHSRVFDIYAGPAIAYIEYDDAKFNVNGVEVKVRVDNETTWDVRAGIDVKPLKWLGIGASIEYIDASADFDAGGGNDGTLDPKPIVTKLGASLRF